MTADNSNAGNSALIIRCNPDYYTLKEIFSCCFNIGIIFFYRAIIVDEIQNPVGLLILDFSI